MKMPDFTSHPALGIYFKDVHYADITSIDGRVSLRAFIAGMLSYYPWWIVWLYHIREVLARILGLEKHQKPEFLPDLRPENVSFTPGHAATFFVVRGAEEDNYWVAETPDDRHLSAFIGVVAEPLKSGMTRFQVFTTIRYKHWTGPVYFNLIRPFHHLVVSRMMRAGIRVASDNRL